MPNIIIAPAKKPGLVLNILLSISSPLALTPFLV